MRLKPALLLTFALGFGLLSANPAEARELEDCQLMWGQAVRSYLTQNRTKGPEDETFKKACEIEQTGDLDSARVEAITIGVKALSGLDQRGCSAFMKNYVGATLPAKICEAAKSEQDMAALRKMVEGSLPPPPKRRPR